MNDQTRQAAIDHARAEYPRESCGLVLVKRGKELFWPCRNIAEGSDNFCMHPEDYAAADEAGDILAVVHSHPDARPTPSQADLVACEASGLPWHIVGIPCLEWAEIKPSGYKAPLVGREWSHGVLDCYAIVRDWYDQERGLQIMDFDRHDDWWHKGENLYVENFEKAGFRQVKSEELQVGDVIIMQILSPVPNHAAVYIGDDMIIHHLHGRLSCRDVFGGYWKKHASLIVRHENSFASR